MVYMSQTPQIKRGNMENVIENFDPTEAMVKQQEQAHNASEQETNERNTDFEGSVNTESYSIQDALDSL